ncbi:MAG: UvrD-helicase domain-containing protein [Treponema sp.]|jgi:superfamily I DNA/RNA helicase/PHP family Zn ribbon phosphoesterase|nr:UvrD-helicase domain-containing protein [Treponema sp.]
MRITADLHIHSRFSRATSSRLNPAWLDRWARIKGLNLIGTGDCTHPLWLRELREQLNDAEQGFYTLKDSVRKRFDAGPALAEELPSPKTASTGFVLTGEISTIYKKDGKTRKVHHLVILPDFDAAAAFQRRLERIGNIKSDGRPILGIDSRDLLAMLLEVNEHSIMIPAHIWTPWFSALGAKSGFDSIEECYGDLTGHIPAIETGLSSNPPMNWALKSLDRFAVISNSDAHSPDKLGRECTVFDMDMSFSSFSAALKNSAGILATVEFFPQEGKYHYDGHRNCGVCLEPDEALAAGDICPVCGKALTRGVMGRVLELADRPVDETAVPEHFAEARMLPRAGRLFGSPPDEIYGNRRPYHSLIPLREMLGELFETGPASKRVDAAYSYFIEKAGSEFAILMDMSPAEIEAFRCPGLSGELLAHAVQRMRSGEVFINPGYDGEYGTVRVFPPKTGRKKSNTAGELFPFGDEPCSDTTGNSVSRGEPSSHCSPVEDTCSVESLRLGLSQNSGFSGASSWKIGPKPDFSVKSKAVVPKSDILEQPRLPGDKFPERKKTETVRQVETAAMLFTLEAEQEKAVSWDGPEGLIIAGPGTGKTAVAAARIARLLEKGVDPGSILALSFSVKAAAELRERSGRISKRGAEVLVCTFHSFCAFILREQEPARGIPSGFRILNDEERDVILQDIIQRKAKKRLSSRRLGTYIETRKRFLLLPGEEVPFGGLVLPGPVGTFITAISGLAKDFGLSPPEAELEVLYRTYRDRLRATGSLVLSTGPSKAGEGSPLDYDDLVAGTVRLLALNPVLLASCRRRFRHILIDEYQDINFAQYALIRLLVPGCNSAEAQKQIQSSLNLPQNSGFFGTSSWEIGLKPDFPIKSKVTVLEFDILEKSPLEGQKPLEVEMYQQELRVIGDPDQSIYGFRGSDKRFIDRFLVDYPGAARFILNRSFRCAAPILEAAGRLTGGRLRGTDAEMVQLYRSSYPSGASEAEGIARRIAALCGGTSFFAIDSNTVGMDGAEPVNPGDCAILIRSAALVRPILKALADHGLPADYAGEIPWQEEEPVKSILEFLRSAVFHQETEGTHTQAASLRSQSPAEAVAAAYQFLQSQKKSSQKTKSDAALHGIPAEPLGEGSPLEAALAHVSAVAGLYRDLPAFLDALSVSGAAEGGGLDIRREGVHVMTIHAAKGLEFEQVFVPALEEGLLPFTLYEDSPVPEFRIEEERRLLYVAMTRARRGLYLSWAESRSFRSGNNSRILRNEPSRFLKNLETLIPLAEYENRRPADPQLKLF